MHMMFAYLTFWALNIVDQAMNRYMYLKKSMYLDANTYSYIVRYTHIDMSSVRNLRVHV